jgi:hypothetical protein
MKVEKVLNEILSPELNQRLQQVEKEILSNRDLIPYLLKTMPYLYKSGYSINVMLNTNYRKLGNKRKSNVADELKKIAYKYDGRATSLADDSVVKIFLREKQ